MKFYVIKSRRGKLHAVPIEYEELTPPKGVVGTFSADCGCDFTNSMVKVNIKCGRCDEKWNEKERMINSNGL